MAINGTVTVNFDKAPTTTPAAADFTVTQAINGGTAAAVTVSTVVNAGAIATLTVPNVVANATTQSVITKVTYGGVTKEVAAFSVAATAPSAIAPKTVELAPISVVENLTATPVVTVKDQNGAVMTSGYTLSYASSNQAVASVATTGIVTAGAYSATANTATLTVTATPTTGAAINGTALISVTADAVKPTIESVTALTGKQIKVVFSEKVDQTIAQTVTNYKLYSVAGTKLYDFVAADASALAGKVVGTASLQADGKTVLINLTNTSTSTTGYVAANEQAGFVLGGMTNSEYVMYVSTVTDKAATANAIVANSNKQFTGVATPDAIAPTLLTAQYDTGLKQLTLSFDEAPATVDVSKVTIVNGTATVALTGASPAYSGLTSTITLTAAQATSLGALQSGATVQLAAGAVKDASTNGNTALATATLAAAVRPEVAVSAYDEATNKLTVKFSQQIKTSTVDVTKVKVQWSTDGTNYTDLASVDTTNYTVGSAGSSATTLEFTLNQTAIDAMGAKRGTANVQYRIGLQDSAVTNAAGTLSNDTGAAAGSDWQYAALTYTKEVTGPAIVSSNLFTTAKATTPRFTGDTTGVQANHMYILFDQKIRPASVTNDGNLTLEHGTTTPKTSVSLTATAGNITAATLLADGKTLDVAFVAGTEVNNIAAGNALVKVTASSALTDVNKNTVSAATPAVTYNNNAVATTITATMHSATQIKLTQANTHFGGTVSSSNFTVYTSTNINDTKSIKSVSLIDSDNNNIKDAIFIELTAAPTSPVTVAFTGLTDSIGGTITNATAAAGALTTDSSAPTLVASASTYTDVDANTAVSAGDKVTLIFNEPVKAKTTPTIAAAYGTGATLTQGTNANEMVVTVGSSPAITFGTTKIEAVAGNMITDITGTNFDGSAVNIPTASGAAAPVFATVGTITATDIDGNGKLSVGDKITIPFDKTLNTSSTIDVTKIALERVGSANTAINAGTTFTAAAVGSNVVLTFTAVNTADVGSVSSAWSATITGSGSGIKSSWGVEIGNIAETYFTANTQNKPYVTSATFNPNTKKLVVKFSEAVNLTALGDASLSDVFSLTTGYTMPAATGTVVGTDFYLDSVDTTNKTVIFNLASAAIDTGLTYINAAAGGATDTGGIFDFDGNKINRNDTTGILIAADANVADTTVPTLTSILTTSANGAGDTIALTFSEAMDTSAVLPTSVTSITGDADGSGNADGAAVTLTTATGAWSNGNKTYTITLDEATDQTALVNGKFYTPVIGANKFRDLAGNSLAALTDGVKYTAAAVTAETTAPTYTIAATSKHNAGDTIVLTFNEVIKSSTLNQAGVRDASDVATIKYNTTAATGGSAITQTTATGAFDATGKIFTITLNEATDSAFIPDGKFIEVILANAAVTDLAGNAVAVTPVYTSAAVAKETTAPTVAWTTTGSGNGVIAAGETLVLTFSEAMTATTINAANINTVLAPNNSHSHKDGAAAITSAVWSSGNTVLTVTYSAGTSAPTITTGDTITATGLTDLAGNALTTVNPFTVAATNF